MQNFCTQIDTAPIGVQEALQENVCVYVRLQDRRAKDKDCLHTCCQLQMLWLWSGCVWRSISLQLLHSMDVFLRFVQNLPRSTSFWLPLLQHNNNKAQPQTPPPPEAEKNLLHPSFVSKARENPRKIKPKKSRLPKTKSQAPPKPNPEFCGRETKRKEKIWWRREGYIPTYPQRGKEWVLRSETPQAPKRFLTPPPFFLHFLLPQMTNTPTLSRSTSTNSIQQNTNI